MLEGVQYEVLASLLQSRIVHDIYEDGGSGRTYDNFIVRRGCTASNGNTLYSIKWEQRSDTSGNTTLIALPHPDFTKPLTYLQKVQSWGTLLQRSPVGSKSLSNCQQLGSVKPIDAAITDYLIQKPLMYPRFSLLPASASKLLATTCAANPPPTSTKAKYHQKHNKSH